MNTFFESNGNHADLKTMVKLFLGCLVDSEWQAINIVDCLKSRGFSSTEISVLLPSRSNSLPEPTSSGASAEQSRLDPGSVASSVLDRALGWLAGFGTVQLTQLRSVVGAGPVMEALSGWNWPILEADDISMPLRSVGLSPNRAQYYADCVASGEILIAVHTEDLNRTYQAEQIFCRLGAKDIGHSSHVTVASLERPGAQEASC